MKPRFVSLESEYRKNNHPPSGDVQMDGSIFEDKGPKQLGNEDAYAVPPDAYRRLAYDRKH